MRLLMIGHLLGDFYFQTDQMARKKKEIKKTLGLHVLIYTLFIYFFAILLTGDLLTCLLPIVLIGLFHFVIDYSKIKVEEKFDWALSKKCIVFLVDQILHVGVLWMIRRLFCLELNLVWIPDSFLELVHDISSYLMPVIAMLLCGKPAAVVISLVFQSIPNTIKKAGAQQDDTNQKNAEEEVKIGSWIGILEREIMLILGLLGQYGAIGFVLTAKSLARYKQFDNQAFAEKYLVGTLLSSLIALICIGICSLC